MGFFDWLFGKAEPTLARPQRPQILSHLGGEDSPWLTVDAGNGVVTIMDREAFDYTCGDSNAPTPPSATSTSCCRR
jgi:hypothetical protein